MGLTGFDSLSSLIVSMPSVECLLVNNNVQAITGENNSFALAA
jgi:hypothetical protein